MISRLLLLTCSFTFIALSLTGLTQTHLDSLWGVWEDQSQSDSARLNALARFGWDAYLFTEPDSAIYYAQIQYDYAESRDDKFWMGSALYTQGVAEYLKGEYTEALNYFAKAMAIKEEIGDLKGIAVSLNGMGLIKGDQGDHAMAIKYYTRSLKILEELGSNGVSGCLNNIAILYQYQGDNEQALVYYERCLKINEENSDKEGIANSLNNIGIIYKDQGEYAKALENYFRSVEIAKEIGYRRGLSNSLINIGNIYELEGDYDQALEYFNESLVIKEEMEDKQGISMSVVSIANIYKETKDYYKAILEGERALSLSYEVGNTEVTREAANILYESYKGIGNKALALEMYELYNSTHDSIVSEENQRELLRQEYKYEYEKQFLADSLNFAKNKAIHDLELKKSENQRIFFILAFVLMILIAAFAYYGFVQKQKANKFLEERNKFEIENKKRAINLFGQQVSKEVALELLSDSFKSGSKKLFACIMFLDIRDFTPYAADKEPDEIIKYQNDVFGFMIDTVARHHGIINQFMGDGFMATFGAPASSGNDCQNAVNASLEIVEILNQRTSSGALPKTRVGIGLHAGNIVTGNVGTIERKQYSITGNTVILASRIEQLNKDYKSDILISKEVFDKLDNRDFKVKNLGAIQLKGRSEPMEILKLL